MSVLVPPYAILVSKGNLDFLSFLSSTRTKLGSPEVADFKLSTGLSSTGLKLCYGAKH